MSSQPGAFARHFRCNCCNNPWNQSSEDVSANSSWKTTTAGLIEICNPCLADNKGYTGIDPNNFDPTVSPRDNFYLWSNGGWKAKNPIPAEYSSWNTFIVLRDLNLERLKVILDELGSTEGQEDDQVGDLKKLKDYFNAFMNEKLINQSGIAPLQDVIALIANAKVSYSRFCFHFLLSLYKSFFVV